jgi:dephospho-CoA kinase
MTVVGITGSLGTGKSTVARMLRAKGAKVLDADRLSHEALKKGGDAHKKVISLFGKGILNKDRSVNKRKLARIVFSNKKKLEKLTGIIHPLVIKEIKKRIKKSRPKSIVVVDAPLLIEAGLRDLVDELIVVKASSKAQSSRCKTLKKQEIRARVKNQMSLARKVKMADYIVNNNGTLTQTKKEVDKIWEKIRK